MAMPELELEEAAFFGLKYVSSLKLSVLLSSKSTLKSL